MHEIVLPSHVCVSVFQPVLGDVARLRHAQTRTESDARDQSQIQMVRTGGSRAGGWCFWLCERAAEETGDGATRQDMRSQIAPLHRHFLNHRPRLPEAGVRLSVAQESHITSAAYSRRHGLYLPD